MGERSTAGSICDTCPVEVNNKLHKRRGRAKCPRLFHIVNTEFAGDFTSRRCTHLFTSWILGCAPYLNNG
jgi:hypothetical protein